MRRIQARFLPLHRLLVHLEHVHIQGVRRAQPLVTVVAFKMLRLLVRHKHAFVVERAVAIEAERLQFSLLLAPHLVGRARAVGWTMSLRQTRTEWMQRVRHRLSRSLEAVTASSTHSAGLRRQWPQGIWKLELHIFGIPTFIFFLRTKD